MYLESELLHDSPQQEFELKRKIDKKINKMSDYKKYFRGKY